MAKCLRGCGSLLVQPRRPLVRPLILCGGVGMLLALAGSTQFLDTADADKRTPTPATHNLMVGSTGSAQPQTMDQFLTAVTTDVDAYWSRQFKAAGLPEPRVGYQWIPAGATAPSACGDANGRLGDSAAAY